MEYWYSSNSPELEELASWSKVSWRCHYSGSYEYAAEAVAGEPELNYANQRCFSNGDSGITLGTASDNKLIGAALYNADDGATWPDSAAAMSMDEEVHFDAVESKDMPAYHYLFAT